MEISLRLRRAGARINSHRVPRDRLSALVKISADAILFLERAADRTTPVPLSGTLRYIGRREAARGFNEIRSQLARAGQR